MVSGSYRVELPRAEGIRLAGISAGWPATPEGRCVQGISGWLAGVERRGSRCVLVSKLSRELWPLLEAVPLQCGPRAEPARGGSPLPGRIEYLGAGAVRLDAAALSALAELGPREDFRVTFTSTGPILTAGQHHYHLTADAP